MFQALYSLIKLSTLYYHVQGTLLLTLAETSVAEGAVLLQRKLN
jgi:hypothetical protein